MYKYFTMVFMLTFLCVSCTPDIKLNLSGCMDTANDKAQVCLGAAVAGSDECVSLDCEKSAVVKSQQCLLDALVDIQVCVVDVQKELENL